MHSDWDCTLPNGGGEGDLMTVRLGLNRVKGLREDDAEKIIAARDGATSVEQLWKQSGCTARAMTCLAKADAFGSFGPRPPVRPLARRQTARRRRAAVRRLLRAAGQGHAPEPAAACVTCLSDYGHTGLSLKDHPMRFLRDDLDKPRRHDRRPTRRRRRASPPAAPSPSPASASSASAPAVPRASRSSRSKTRRA